MRFTPFLLTIPVAIAALAPRQFVDCSCSPTSRGYTVGSRDSLSENLLDLREREAALLEEQEADASITKESITSTLTTEAEEQWNSCVTNYSYEECVNADAALRHVKNEYQTSFCKFDKASGRNGDKPPCDTVPKLATTDANLLAGRPEVNSSTPTPNSDPPVRSDKVVRTPPPGEVHAALPIPEKKPASEAVDEHEMAVEINTPVLKNEATPEPKPANEGCVAVEHLTGYVLQHRSHLRRRVLCANGFCATPNHALIVEGEWTSMKLLCAARWDCVESVKLVNNLLVTANRRAVVGDITITPYDVRFPRFAVWVVQIAEQLLYLINDFAIVSAMALGATMAVVKLSF